MDEACIHCGHPAQTVAKYGLMHRVPCGRDPGATKFQRACPDGSGHIACLSQGGVE